MEDPDQLSGTEKRRGSVSNAALWLVCISVALATVWVSFIILGETGKTGLFSATPVREESIESWEGFSVEQKIAASSVIVLVKNERTADKLQATISEILKKDDATRFQYSVGSELPDLSRIPRQNANYGDGAVVFFAGPAAMMRESYATYNGTIPGLNMSLENLRKLLYGQKLKLGSTIEEGTGAVVRDFLRVCQMI